MSDIECEACAAGETWDDKAGVASLEEHHSLIARLRADNARLRAEVEQLVAELIREHDEAESYRQDRTRMVRSRERCRTCALVDEARRTIGGEGGA